MSLHPLNTLSETVGTTGLVSVAGGKRKLEYAIFGEPHRYTRTAIFFHGTPGSRLDAAYLSDAAKAKQLRLVAFNRLGIGKSDYHADRTILSFATDIKGIVEGSSPSALHLNRFYLLGYSNGTSSALACAYLIPDNYIRGVGIIAGLAPWSLAEPLMSDKKKKFAKMALDPKIVIPMDLAFGRAARRDPKTSGTLTSFDTRMDLRVKLLDETRQQMYKQHPELLRILKDSKRETCKSPKALRHDATLLQRDWGFEITPSLTTRPITLWYGGADADTTSELGLLLARKLGFGTSDRVAYNQHHPALREDTHHTIVAFRGSVIFDELLSQGEFRRRASLGSICSNGIAKPPSEQPSTSRQSLHESRKSIAAPRPSKRRVSQSNVPEPSLSVVAGL